MKVVVEITVICTIEDPIKLIQMARDEVDRIKRAEDRAVYYPSSPSDAIQQLLRTTLASGMLSNPTVTLHKIAHCVKDIEMPL